MDLSVLVRPLSRYFLFRSEYETGSISAPESPLQSDDYFYYYSADGVLHQITFSNLEFTLKTPRIYTTTSSASLALNYNTYDYYELTAQAEPLVFAAPVTTSYVGGEKFIVVATCDATARAITFTGAKWVFKGGIAQPSTLIASKKTTFGFIYHKATDTINLIGLAQEV